MFDRSGCFVFQDAFVDKFEMLVLRQIILQFKIMLMLAIYSLHYVVKNKTEDDRHADQNYLCLRV